ncbi:MAG: GAF domain-containing protein [Ignavibacteriaceae bacterium]|nr:GAF domain-containing protein [Ignavibacteriaceae bacterium]
MDRKQRRRFLIFLVVPLLAGVLLLADDITVRVIALALIIIYVAFIIFLRDSLKFQGDYIEDSYEDSLLGDASEPEPKSYDDSFKIVGKNINPEVIVSSNFPIDGKISKTSLKPADLKERFKEIANEEVPKEIGHGGQFSFALEKILTVIKEVYYAYSVIFFWYNVKKQKFSIDKFVSNSIEISSRKFDIEDDILSKIVQKGEPELLTDISPIAELDVIRYYDSKQGIRSFVGVPIFYDNSLIAIITLDSKVEDAFGIETIFTLGRFVRVITMIISIFEEKHSDSISQQRLNNVLQLIGSQPRLENEEDLSNFIQNSFAQLVSWDAFTFIYFLPLEKKFKIAKVLNNTSLKYVGQNLEIEMNGTLTGKCITSGMSVKIDDTSIGDVRRFTKNETVTFDGSFLAIPIVHKNQNFGVICFESLKKNAYSNEDVQFLKSSANFLSFTIHSFSSQHLLKSFITLDIETRTLNSASFKERVTSDLYKAVHLKVPSTIALVRIDDFLEQESLFDDNPFPKVLKSVAEIISSEMTPLTTLGRISEKVFGVYFFNSSTKDIFLWAEKLRVKIARKPIAVFTKQTTYTVSVGIASANNKTDVDEIIYNAELALQKALERGGNTVRSIN